MIAYGPIAGGEAMALGVAANENRPKLHTYDRFGNRIDEVEFHPAYHRLMELGVEHGVTGFAWRHAQREGAHVARAALMYLHNQADQGTSCPLTMTYACVPSLEQQPELAREWLPRVVATAYDGRSVPACDEGREHDRHGDDGEAGRLRRARQHDARDARRRARDRAQLYELVGHKWFFSAPMSDAFLVLAQTDEGLSCFLLPRFTPDGARNAVRIQRLKDKLGDWSNASAEVEFQGALAWMVGEPGRGVATILADGGAHAAGLHHRLGEHHAPGARAGGAPRAAPAGVRQAAGGAAADAKRARRPRAGVARRRRRWRSASRAPSTRARATSGSARWRASSRPSGSTGCASGARRS